MVLLNRQHASAFEAARPTLVYGQRVRSIRENGWKRTECTLDVAELASEHVTRCEFFQRMRREKQTTDWQQVRAYLDVLLGLMEEPMTNRA